MKQFFEENNTPWYEPVQNGVVRGLKNRDNWQKKCADYHTRDLFDAPQSIKKLNMYDDMPSCQQLGLQEQSTEYFQRGGRQAVTTLITL